MPSNQSNIHNILLHTLHLRFNNRNNEHYNHCITKSCEERLTLIYKLGCQQRSTYAVLGVKDFRLGGTPQFSGKL